MQKKILFLLILDICAFSFFGCNALSGSGQGLQTPQDKASTPQKKSSVNAEYSIEEGNLSIHVTMSVPEGLSIYKVNAREYDMQNAVSTIKSGYTDEQWMESTFDSFDENGKAVTGYRWTLGEEKDIGQKSIAVSSFDMNMILDGEGFNKCLNSFREPGVDYENTDRYKEIDGREDRQQITGWFLDAMEKSKLPIGDMDYGKCYFLNQETMKEQEGVQDYEGNLVSSNYTWSDADNYYRIYARQTYQGLPVYYTDGELGVGLSLRVMPVTATVKQNDHTLVDCSIERLYEFSSDGESLELMNTDEIMELVRFRYEDILTESKFSVENAELMYYVYPADGNAYSECEMIPVWVFEAYEIDDTGYASYESFMLNAVTGEEVYVE